MHLIDLLSLRLRDFPANEILEYAILSHTWGEDKVLFADVERGIDNGKKIEYKKIRFSCKKAAAHGLGYV